jgi:hypothetical protein
MKILLVIATVLIISVSLFLLALDKDTKAKNKKRDEIFNPKIRLPRTGVVSFADKVAYATTLGPELGPACTPTLLDPYGETQLLNMDAFIGKYYSDQNITDYRACYESEALSIADRYQIEEFVRKKESDRFHF